MPITPRYLTALLSALQFTGSSREELRTLTDSDWETLLSLWDIHRLLVPLRQICAETCDLPEWVRARIDHNLACNALRLERIKAAYGAFSDALRGTDAEHLVIKGFTLWPGFVDHPRFRLQSDIDIYCPPRSIPLAFDALSALGYEPKSSRGIQFADHLPEMRPKSSWKWQGTYYDPDMPVSFELHFCFWNHHVHRLRPSGLEQFWDRRIERRLDEISFPALCEVDNFGYTALNSTRCLLQGGQSLYQVYGLARFLHVNADARDFWREWRQTHDESLRRVEAVACCAALRLFGCRLPEEVLETIDLLPMASRQWFEHFKNIAVSPEFQKTKESLWLHLSLMQSLPDRLSIVRRRLLPMPAIPQADLDLPNVFGDRHRQPASLWLKSANYLAYVISRSSHHLSVLPIALWRGDRFWWSTKSLSAQFWDFFAASFLFDVGMFMFSFLYNLYLLSCGYKEDLIGLVASANSVGSVVGCIPSGIVAQRIGLRRSLILCIALVALISSLLTLVPSKPALLTLSFFLGAVSTLWAVVMSPATAQLTTDQNRQFGFSLIFSSGIAVGLLGSSAASRLPGWLTHVGSHLTDIRAKQLTLLIGCVIVAAGAWPAAHIRFPSFAPPKRTIPRGPFFSRYLIAIAVWSLVTGAFSPFHNVYFSKYLHMRIERIGAVVSVSQVVQALAILGTPILFRRAGLVNGIVYTQIATAVCLACLVPLHDQTIAAVIYVAFTACQWMNEPGIYTLLMDHVAPSEQAGASALSFLVISLATAIATAIAGSSFASLGYPAVLAATGSMALIAAVFFRFMLGRKVVDQIPAGRIRV